MSLWNKNMFVSKLPLAFHFSLLVFNLTECVNFGMIHLKIGEIAYFGCRKCFEIRESDHGWPIETDHLVNLVVQSNGYTTIGHIGTTAGNPNSEYGAFLFDAVHFLNYFTMERFQP